MEQWLWAERTTSNRRKPSDSDRDVPSCVVTYPYPAKNITILVPCFFLEVLIHRCARFGTHLRIAANADTPARARICSLRYAGSSHRNGVAPRTRAAPATHGPLRAAARTQRLFIVQDRTRRYHHPRWPRRARAVCFSCSGFPPSFWPAVFAHAHARARPHARTRRTTDDDPYRNPYRHASARRPPRKARPFVSQTTTWDLVWIADATSLFSCTLFFIFCRLLVMPATPAQKDKRFVDHHSNDGSRQSPLGGPPQRRIEKHAFSSISVRQGTAQETERFFS